MSKLKLCVLVPALSSGPANSLFPTQQSEKQRKFLIVVESSTSIGALYNILLEKYQETYLDDQLRRDFWIEKLQDENEIDLTRELVLSDFLDDPIKLHTIRLIRGSLDRCSSIPQATALRPQGFAQKRSSDEDASSSKRRKLDNLDVDYVNADPDRPRPSTEHASPPPDAARSAINSAQPIKTAGLETARADDLDQSHHDLDTELKAIPAADRLEQSTLTSDGFLKPSLPPFKQPSKRTTRTQAANISRQDEPGETIVSAEKRGSRASRRTRATAAAHAIRDGYDTFEVPATDDERFDGSPSLPTRNANSKAPPPLFHSNSKPLTPVLDTESSQERNLRNHRKKSNADTSKTTNHSRPPSVTTSAKALKRVREYRRARGDLSDVEKLPTSAQGPRLRKSKSNSLVFQNNDDQSPDPIESSDAASPRKPRDGLSSAAKTASQRKQGNQKSLSVASKASASRSAPSTNLQSSREGSAREGVVSSARAAADESETIDTEQDATSTADYPSPKVACTPYDLEAYAASQRLSLQARMEESDRRRIEDQRSPQAERKRNEGEKKALNYFSNTDTVIRDGSPLARRSAASAHLRADRDPPVPRSNATLGRLSTGPSDPTTMIRPSQELTPTSEPLRNVPAIHATMSEEALHSHSNDVNQVKVRRRSTRTSTSARTSTATSKSRSRNITTPRSPPRDDSDVYTITRVQPKKLVTYTSATKAKTRLSDTAATTSAASKSNAAVSYPRAEKDFGPGSTQSPSADRSPTPGPSKVNVRAQVQAQNPKSPPGKLKSISRHTRKDLKQGHLPFQTLNNKGKQPARLSMKMRESETSHDSRPSTTNAMQSFASKTSPHPSASEQDNCYAESRASPVANDTAEPKRGVKPVMVTSGSEDDDESSDSDDDSPVREKQDAPVAASSSGGHLAKLAAVDKTMKDVSPLSSGSAHGFQASDVDRLIRKTANPNGVAGRLESRPSSARSSSARSSADRKARPDERSKSPQPVKREFIPESSLVSDARPEWPKFVTEPPATGELDATKSQERDTMRLRRRKGNTASSPSPSQSPQLPSARVERSDSSAQVSSSAIDGTYNDLSPLSTAATPRKPKSPELMRSSPKSNALQPLENGEAPVAWGSQDDKQAMTHALEDKRSRSVSLSSTSSSSSDSSFSSHSSDDADAQLQLDLKNNRESTKAIDPSSSAGLKAQRSLVDRARTLTSFARMRRHPEESWQRHDQTIGMASLSQAARKRMGLM